MASELPHRSSTSRTTRIAKNSVVHTWDDGELTQPLTKSTDPNDLLSFFNQLVDHYESDVDDREELPMFVEIGKSGYIYVRDHQGGEWVMWSVNEWVAPKPEADTADWNRSDKEALDDDRSGLNLSVVHTILQVIRGVYETPGQVREDLNRYQIESFE